MLRFRLLRSRGICLLCGLLLAIGFFISSSQSFSTGLGAAPSAIGYEDTGSIGGGLAPRAAAPYTPPRPAAPILFVPGSRHVGVGPVLQRVAPSADGKALMTTRIPSCAVLDLSGSPSLLINDTIALTQVLWNEVRRTRFWRLQRLEYTRRDLSTRGLTPNDPYRMPPSHNLIATVLDVDYLVFGNVNQLNDVCVLELMIYSAASDSIVRSVPAKSTTGYRSLVEAAPDMVRDLQKDIPKWIAVKKPVPTATPEGIDLTLLKKELAELRTENEALREKLQQAGLDTNVAVVKENTPVVSPTPAKIDKLPPPSSNIKYKNPGVKKVIGKTPTPKVHTPEPTATPKPTAKPTRTPTPKITITPVPTKAPIVQKTPSPTATPTPAPEPTSPSSKLEAKKLYNQAMSLPQKDKSGLEPIRKAAAYDPSNKIYQQELLTRLYACDEFKECAKLGTNLSFSADTSYIPLYTAAALYELREYEQAIKVLDRLLQRDPTDGFALYNRALNLKEFKPSEAKAAFEHFLEVARDNPSLSAYVLDSEKQIQLLSNEAAAGGR